MERYFTKLSLVISMVLASASAYAQATIDSLNQNADQSQGMYQPMNMGYTGISSLGMTQSAWLDPLQNLGEGQSKPAYSKYYWSPDLVLPIRLREGMITLLNFPQWELVEDVYIGDSKTFDGRISGPNTLLLYPKSGAMVGVDTNIIVFGRSGNKYVFYARSEGINTERLTNSIIDIEVIDAASPQGKAGTGNGSSRVNASAYRGGNNLSVDSNFTKRFQKDDWIQSIPLDPTQFKFDIEVYVPNPDDVVIAPERVWRDDIFTYIDLGEKALNMVQRPIVTLIVERVETPVGFRAKGPNNRLIIVEGVGDMVLRNGKRIVCLKLRRSDDADINPTYYNNPDEWDVSEKLPLSMNNVAGSAGAPAAAASSANAAAASSTPAPAASGADLDDDEEDNSWLAKYYTPPAGSGSNADKDGFSLAKDSSVGQEALVGEYNEKVGADGELLIPQYLQDPSKTVDYSKMHKLPHLQADSNKDVSNLLSSYGYGSGFADAEFGNISVELGTDADVNNLEGLWNDLSGRYTKLLGSYQPFYSVDAPADGQGRELYHLRIGPVPSIEKGDKICSQLGRNGVFCSVVRVQ